MMKTSRRSLSCLMALSCLSACDPAYTVPVEVHLSEGFLAQWDAGYPVEIAVRYESATQSQFLSYDAWGRHVGDLCAAPSGPAKFQTRMHELGCVPEDLQVTAWIAPNPRPTQGSCVQPTDAGTLADGGLPPSCVLLEDGGFSEGCMSTHPGPGPDGHFMDTDTQPEHGITRMAKAKKVSCAAAQTVILEF